MLILVSIVLLFIAVTSMLLIHAFWPDFLYHWLIAVGGALFAWLAMLATGSQLPLSLTLIDWQTKALLSESPILLADELSWPYALALVTLALAVILTDVVRAAEADWSAWSGTLILGALGLFAVLAGNPLTLLLAWMAIDLAELLILLAQLVQSTVRERVVIAFSARVLGSLLLIGGEMAARSGGASLNFEFISSRAAIFLVLAAGLRLGVLPLHVPFLQEPRLRRGLGTMSRLVPAAASLVLLARTAEALRSAPGPVAYFPYLLGLAGLAGLYGGLAWFLAPDELEGRPAWILGMASLSLAAALRAQPAASLAWGLATLFCGGLVFLTSIHDKRLLWLSFLGLLSFTAMPFTPAWNGSQLFTAPFHPLLAVFMVAQALLLAGYARHALRSSQIFQGVEQWIWLIYPLGLGLLPLTYFWIGTRSYPSIANVPIVGWLLGVIAVVLAILAISFRNRIGAIPAGPILYLQTFLSLNWFYRMLWITYRYLGRFATFLTSVLEGEGGVLWAILLLVLLFSVLVWSNGGG
jgi:hypothetical protein